MAVDPRGISRTCAACGEDDRRNRAGKVLSIAAITRAMQMSSALEKILIKTLVARGRVMSPGQKCPQFNEMFLDRP